jgi:hypothetical protein
VIPLPSPQRAAEHENEAGTDARTWLTGEPGGPVSVSRRTSDQRMTAAACPDLVFAADQTRERLEQVR